MSRARRNNLERILTIYRRLSSPGTFASFDPVSAVFILQLAPLLAPRTKARFGENNREGDVSADRGQLYPGADRRFPRHLRPRFGARIHVAIVSARQPSFTSSSRAPNTPRICSQVHPRVSAVVMTRSVRNALVGVSNITKPSRVREPPTIA